MTVFGIISRRLATVPTFRSSDVTQKETSYLIIEITTLRATTNLSQWLGEDLKGNLTEEMSFHP
ncbi:MAG: hypothetical protein ACKPBT_20475 [Microcystis aeruginosa]